MKTSEVLIIGGVGLVLLLAIKKKQAAAQAVAGANLANSTGGRPQPGVSYATPTATAGLISGAVNGILNWVSGTPKTSSAAPAGSAGITIGDIGQGAVFNNPVDSLSDYWDNAVGKINAQWGIGNDGSIDGVSNPQNGAQLGVPSLASFLGPLGNLG